MNRRRPRRLPGYDYSLQGSFFVTFCTKNREPVFGETEAATIAVDVLEELDREQRFRLIAYCIMADHIHIYFRKLDASEHLSRLVAEIKSRITKRLRGSIAWQRGYWDEIVRSYEDPSEIVAYILNNPVRAGIVSDFREYRFSGPSIAVGRAD